MTKDKWVRIATQAGKEEQAARLDPLPKGPYVIVSQFEETDFQNNYLTMHTLNISQEFKLDWGTAVYICDDNFKPKKVAYHYDTSG